jgi:hypothetical protein
MKRIVVPTTAESQDIIYHTWGRGDEYVEWTLTDEEWSVLCRKRVTEKLSEYTDEPLDDGEFSVIDDPSRLTLAREDLLKFANSTTNQLMNSGVNKLVDSLTKAIQFKTSLYFFF